MADHAGMSRPRVRLVRRQTLGERISSAPGNLWMSAAEWYLSTDWDAVERTHTVSAPIAFVLNLGVIVCRCLAVWAGPTSHAPRREDIFAREPIEASAIATGSGSQRTISLLAYGLFILSVFNTYKCYAKRRTYQLLKPSANIAQEANVELETVSDSSTASSPLATVAKLLSGRRDSEGTRKVWTLRVWDPPLLQLRLACLFSPVNVACLWLLPLQLPTILVTLCVSLQMYYLCMRSQQLLRDRQVLSREYIHEYDTSFVNPHVFAPRREVAVNTEPEGFASGIIEVSTPQHLLSRGGTLSKSSSPTPFRNAGAQTALANNLSRDVNTSESSSAASMAFSTPLRRGPGVVPSPAARAAARPSFTSLGTPRGLQPSGLRRSATATSPFKASNRGGYDPGGWGDAFTGSPKKKHGP